MSLERLEITPFAVIAGEILQNRRSGHLTIVRGPLRNVLYWSQGELVLMTSVSPHDSLADFLARRGVITADRASQLVTEDATDVVSKFHETGMLDLSTRQTLLREWITSLFIPLFSLDEGTSAFSEEVPLPPEKRVFLQSTGALILEGIRSITNGLVLRRSLGDLKRDIVPARDSRYAIDAIALTDPERRIASLLAEPQTIEAFLRRFSIESVTAAKVVIGMLALGVYTTFIEAAPQQETGADSADMQRDLELLSAIGSSDQRSLRAVALSRQLASMDHYQFLDVPRAATRSQIITSGERLKKIYDPMTFPPIVRESVQMIDRRIDEATSVLKEPSRRASYDKVLSQPGQRGAGEAAIQQRLTQRSIAQQNFTKARELSSSGDYYGAIVLLKQAVNYAPDFADAWFLLGSCQERNPKWRRDAAESLQMTLSVDPNHVEAMISLGDLYKLEGLSTRAQTCYEDALKIAPDNQQAKSRLAALKRK